MAAPRKGQNVDGRYSVHVGTVPRFKPFHDRLVPVRKIPCPDCAADVGEPCLTQAGTPRSTPHPGRRRMALRKGL